MKTPLYINFVEFCRNYKSDKNIFCPGLSPVDYFRLLKLNHEKLKSIFVKSKSGLYQINFEDEAGFVLDYFLANFYTEKENPQLCEVKPFAIGNEHRNNLTNIIQELQEIINELNNWIEIEEKTNPEGPENDFSNNSDKEKIIILEKLGIIDFVKKLQERPDVISHTAEILSSFTGINAKSLNTYLNPILRPYKDPNDKNSPYKNPDNEMRANRAIQKLKIRR